MSDRTPYTPSLEQAADNYVEGMIAFYGESGEMEYRAQFGRLIAHVRAEAWDAGFDKATSLVGTDFWSDAWSDDHNPHRAARIERGETDD